MLLLKLGIMNVLKTFLPARFLRSPLFLLIWKNPQNAARDSERWIQNWRLYIFYPWEVWKKKSILYSGSDTEICNVTRRFCQFSLN